MGLYKALNVRVRKWPGTRGGLSHRLKSVPLLMSVSFKNVTKHFGNTIVVVDLSLEIDDGAFVVLLGPSGCGKTTTLRMLAGLEAATSGDILINNERINDVPTQHRDLAMVFEDTASTHTSRLLRTSAIRCVSEK